jgi:hypothetical protein
VVVEIERINFFRKKMLKRELTSTPPVHRRKIYFGFEFFQTSISLKEGLPTKNYFDPTIN